MPTIRENIRTLLQVLPVTRHPEWRDELARSGGLFIHGEVTDEEPSFCLAHWNGKEWNCLEEAHPEIGEEILAELEGQLLYGLNLSEEQIETCVRDGRIPTLAEALGTL